MERPAAVEDAAAMGYTKRGRTRWEIGMDEPLYQLLGMSSWASFAATNAVLHVFDAIVCALIARNRGRDVRGWVLAALAGGVLAMAALLLLPRRKPAAPTQRAVEA